MGGLQPGGRMLADARSQAAALQHRTRCSGCHWNEIGSAGLEFWGPKKGRAVCALAGARAVSSRPCCSQRRRRRIDRCVAGRPRICGERQQGE